MDKAFADQTIIKFQKLFFGFALSKTSDIAEAEELASRIVLEAYSTMLKTEGIDNWDGYLYKIAYHVYAKYVKERIKIKSVSIDDIDMPLETDFTCEVENGEEFKLLKREIAYLGNLQRKIIVLHYYQHQKIQEIAKQLSLSAGAVKWHLYDSRLQLKEGIRMMRLKGDLGLSPISFIDMGHNGSCGDAGDTNYYLNSKLKQNIAYAAYDQPRTITEIADELGITPVFIEDEVNYLEEYGFLDKLNGGRYRTNIFINRSSMECEAEKVNILKSFAQRVCDEYIPLVKKALDQLNATDIYIPDNDAGLLLWSVIPYIMEFKVNDDLYYETLMGTNYKVKRKDGGEYIAFATLKQDYLETLDEMYGHYKIFGCMTRYSGHYPIASWQISSNLDSREIGWMDNKAEDYDMLYLFMTGRLPKVEALADKYQRLYERGLITNDNTRDLVNVVIIKTNKQEDLNYPYKKDFIKLMPDIPAALLKSVNETSERLYELQKEYYPKHMHRLLKALNLNCLRMTEVRIMVLDELLERGVIKKPSEVQKKGITTLVFSDTLPEMRA
jgi:RNA polymerase sigma factor (sigma-70 family)